jgi:small-conductance mechanosensitive channel
VRELTMSSMADWPGWVANVFWTAGFILAAYVAGHILKRLLAARLSRLPGSAGPWGPLVLDVLRRRVGLWSLLVGTYLSLLRWALPVDVHALLVRVLSAIGVASVTLALATLTTQLVVSYGSRASVVVTGLTQNVVRIVVITIGALVIVRSFGYDIGPMLTVLGIGGLTVALALQEPLSNLFAGLFVSFAGQIRVGDFVKIDSGAEGHIADFNWRSVRLRHPSGNFIEIPNAVLSKAVVTNYSLPTPEMGMTVDVTVRRDASLEEVERVALEVGNLVVKEVPGVAPGSEPVVRFKALTDATVTFAVGVRIREFADQSRVKHELVKRLDASFRAEGISLVSSRGAGPNQG